ncbi:Type I restriction-modification system,DNA-methyltransferase subunit M [Staphylococcus aureus]|uniref:site-specific DNA-methyltransferase (adenine-specific) n=1 Tax=Staphylococcus aureus TaxID=1280 RepID=A0A2X2JZI9_STAAU|nr:Type I restriction-modification system,DNA-methyltransferase subunit M [Staphylococcus aureus]
MRRQRVKKAGEFYTPQQVSKILAKIVTDGKDKLRHVYDPTCGSGSLLLRVGKETQVYRYFGQERNNTTYNLARMKHVVTMMYVMRTLISVMMIRWKIQPFLGNTFDAVIANPPYSAKWTADSKFENDERFSGYGKLAPKSKADFAFIQHMVHYLDDEGTMAVVLPHGCLIPWCRRRYHSSLFN